MRAPAAVLLLVVLSATVAACGPRMVEADVTRFSATAQGPAPGRVSIVPSPDQRGSLEFEAYADMVAEELRLHGFQPVAADAVPGPDYTVRLDWGVGDPVTQVYSSPTTLYGGTSIFGSRTGYGIGMGIPLGGAQRVDSYTQYPKSLRVAMRPASAPPGGMSEPSNVFEGRATTTAGGPGVEAVMPYLVEAVFTNFPGRSGITEEVRIPQRR